MQELEYLEGLVVGGARGEEEQLVLDDRVEEGRRVGRRQVDQRGSRGGVREVQRQQGAAGGRAAIVDVLEERVAGQEGQVATSDICGGGGFTCAHQR